MKRILFHRDYRRFFGGHLKVFDYYQHTKHFHGFEPNIFLSRETIADNPWKDETGVVGSYDPANADALFVAGMDWKALDDHPGIEQTIPVINLIQGMRHASPDLELYQYLSRQAVRICVSSEVERAILSTGRCNGPVHVIPNGIDMTGLPVAPDHAEVDVFIAGLKHPLLARQLADRLTSKGLRVDCITSHVARGEFLRRMSRASIAALIPYAEEGFYLPPLEAMAMGVAVVCPDCVGNRSFCIDGVTAIVPQREITSLEDAALRLWRSPDLAAALRSEGLSTSARFDIRTERSAYHELLRQIGIR